MAKPKLELNKDCQIQKRMCDCVSFNGMMLLVMLSFIQIWRNLTTLWKIWVTPIIGKYLFQME
jgi:hypothetical protein